MRSYRIILSIFYANRITNDGAIYHQTRNMPIVRPHRHHQREEIEIVWTRRKNGTHHSGKEPG